MNNDIEFKSITELYKRVLPALYSKVKEMNRIGYTLVGEKDIWNYLVDNSWRNRTNLDLHDLINDILYADNVKINDYVTDKLNDLKRQTEIINISDVD